MNKTLYITGSLRNPRVPEIANAIESWKLGWEAFDAWYSAGERADDCWQYHETLRGHNYFQAIEGYHAWHVFNFDKHHLDRSQAGLLILPAGKSCHIEFGYLVGQGKPGLVLFDTFVPDRYDVMYRFAHTICRDLDQVKEALKKL
jgi:hypothetical protein